MAVCKKCGQDESVRRAGDIPFRCVKCGAVYVNLKPPPGFVFVYQDRPPERIGAVILPFHAHASFARDTATVVAVGGDYTDRRRKVMKMVCKVGDRVVFDKDLPSRIEWEGADGAKHEIVRCGMHDCKVFIEEK